MANVPVSKSVIIDCFGNPQDRSAWSAARRVEPSVWTCPSCCTALAGAAGYGEIELGLTDEEFDRVEHTFGLEFTRDHWMSGDAVLAAVCVAGLN